MVGIVNPYLLISLPRPSRAWDRSIKVFEVPLVNLTRSPQPYRATLRLKTRLHMNTRVPKRLSRHSEKLLLLLARPTRIYLCWMGTCKTPRERIYSRENIRKDLFSALLPSRICSALPGGFRWWGLSHLFQLLPVFSPGSMTRCAWPIFPEQIFWLTA